ncbi:HIRAN domain-containing protein [Aeromicrobium sp. Sec7.5]|uniref:HIRAN domain-containing protein n=1 Tax=Aeromicrobium sp. Sec7.5 TaxID=3121276 RepID=UPI002FE43CE8
MESFVLLAVVIGAVMIGAVIRWMFASPAPSESTPIDARSETSDVDAEAIEPTRGRTVASASISRSEYMTADEEAAAITVDAGGRINGRLSLYQGQLVLVVNDRLVNMRSRHLYRHGIFAFGLRGTSYFERAARDGDFTPGTMVHLVREVDNKFDPNAVAVCATRTASKAGYANKLNAGRIAKLLDAGVALSAVSIQGDGPGSLDGRPNILVAETHHIRHLLSGR